MLFRGKCIRSQKNHMHMERGLCTGLEKCCFCPVWKLPRAPLLMVSGSCLLAESPRYSWRARGLSEKRCLTDNWQVTPLQWTKEVSFLPSSLTFFLFFIINFFFFKEEKHRETKQQEEKSCGKRNLQTRTCCGSGWANASPLSFRRLSSLPTSRFLSWDQIPKQAQTL